MKKLIFLFCVLISAFAEKARFDNYRVYKVKIENIYQLQELRQLADTSDSVNCLVLFLLCILICIKFQYSFFNYPRAIGSDVELIVAPHMFAHFSDITKSLKLQHEIMTSNLQR